MDEQLKQEAIKTIEKAISVMLQDAYYIDNGKADMLDSLCLFNSCAELNELKLTLMGL